MSLSVPVVSMKCMSNHVKVGIIPLSSCLCIVLCMNHAVEEDGCARLRRDNKINRKSQLKFNFKFNFQFA